MIDGVLGPKQFALRELTAPHLDSGKALVRIKLINIHAGTRSRMASGMTKLGDTDHSNYACAEVIQSRDPAFKEGDVIACQAGWQEYQVISSSDGPIGYEHPSELVKALNGTNSQWNYVFRPAMVKMWSPDILMEMFGTSGMTAYFGMQECGPLAPKDRVAVAGVTGSVGSIVAQLAKAAGSYVVGFGGGAARCTWAREALGIDECLNYKSATLDEDLSQALPGGIDVYSDGIGGSLTAIVAKKINRNGRLFSFGVASAYYSGELIVRPSLKADKLRELFGLSAEIEKLLKRNNIKCAAWIVDSFYHDRIQAENDISRMLLSGALKPINNVVEGFENLPSAVIDLYRSSHAGKLQVCF